MWIFVLVLRQNCIEWLMKGKERRNPSVPSCLYRDPFGCWCRVHWFDWSWFTSDPRPSSSDPGHPVRHQPAVHGRTVEFCWPQTQSDAHAGLGLSRPAGTGRENSPLWCLPRSQARAHVHWSSVCGMLQGLSADCPGGLVLRGVSCPTYYRLGLEVATGRLQPFPTDLDMTGVKVEMPIRLEFIL